jgi:MFS transporter, OFA family, oxalate/formate antiporter
VFSILMPLTGFYIERFGPRRVIAFGAVIMGLGYIASGFASNITMLVLTYGIIAGAGVGIVYGVLLAVVAKWFPDKKGLAVGTTVVGFGLSPLITAPLANHLIKTNAPEGWRDTLVTFGIAFTIIMLLAALLMQYPPQGRLPRGWTPPVTPSRVSSSGVPMLQSRSFYGLWLCFVIGTFVGLAAIGTARQVAKEIIQIESADFTAFTVSLFAVFNGLGRPFFGWFADRFTPRLGAIVCYVLLIIASILMWSAGPGTVSLYLVAFCMITFAFGGWLALAPTATLIFFRPEDYAKNYGIVFTAFGMGALLGTLTAGRIRDLFGSYQLFFGVTLALAAIGVVLAVFLMKRLPSTAVAAELES